MPGIDTPLDPSQTGSAISRIESRSRYVMGYEIPAIARALKITVASLFGDGPGGVMPLK